MAPFLRTWPHFLELPCQIWFMICHFLFITFFFKSWNLQIITAYGCSLENVFQTFPIFWLFFNTMQICLIQESDGKILPSCSKTSFYHRNVIILHNLASCVTFGKLCNLGSYLEILQRHWESLLNYFWSAKIECW